MKNCNFDFTFKNLKDEDIGGEKAYELLANILTLETPNLTPRKASAIARNLYEKKEISLDPDDLKNIKLTIEQTKLNGPSNLMKAQMLEVLDQ